MSKKKIIIAVIVVVVLVIVLYFVFKKKKDTQEAGNVNMNFNFEGPSDSSSPANSSTTPETNNPPFPLKKGSKCKEVLQLQNYLHSKGAVFPTYGLSGVYDEDTDASVRKILKRDNISESYYNKCKMSEY